MVPVYLDNTLVHFKQVYYIDELPKQEEYIEIDNYKGYVVDIQKDEDKSKGDYILYSIYYEDNIGDWYEREIDCNVLNVMVNKEVEG